MDVRVLLIYVAVAYVDVSARIMCNFHPQSWTYAMAQCLQLRGTLVGKSTELPLTGLHLNGSFWTADYASWTETASSPIECEYRTKGTGIQISQIKSGNCVEMKHFICRDHNMTKPSVKTGTWKEASKCNETYSEAVVEMPVGDYWLKTAYQNYVLTGYDHRTIDRCGTLYVIGTFQFVSNCFTSQYSFCEVENYTGSVLSVCGSTIVTNQSFTNAPSFASQKTDTFISTIMPINENTSTESILRNNSSSSSVSRSTMVTTQPSSNIPSFASQNTEQLTLKIMSINENTSTDSIVRNHAHNSSVSGSVLAIVLGVSLSIVIIVIITTFGVCVYRKRKRNADCVHSREECGRTELGDIHVYDEISNNEESLYAASKVYIYDKLRNDVEKEHAYDIIASAP